MLVPLVTLTMETTLTAAITMTLARKIGGANKEVSYADIDKVPEERTRDHYSNIPPGV